MDQLGCGLTLKASLEATGTNGGSTHNVPAVKSAGSTDTSVSTTEEELPMGSELWDGMKQIAQCISALASIPLHECMKYIIKRQGCDLSQPCGRCLFVDSTFHTLEGRRWYARVVVRGTIGYFLVDSGAAVRCVGRKFFDS